MDLPESLDIACTGESWDPQLPVASAHAMFEHPIPTVATRYDLVCLSGVDASPRTQLINAFRRGGHRVFPVPPDGSRLTDAALATTRTAQSIAVAATFGPGTAWGASALVARERWGWKIVVDLSEPEDAVRDASSARQEQVRRLLRHADVVVGPASALDHWGDAIVGSGVAWEPHLPPDASYSRLDRAIRAAFPRISIVMVTFDNLLFTKLCMTSLLNNTAYPNYELIVVDNGSNDGTLAYLRAVAAKHPHVRVLAQGRNLGFGPATNRGLAAATGDVLILLNNDTIVPTGWLARLERHLADPTVGIVGPMTNRTCNEAQIAGPYRTYGEFGRFAQERARAYDGERGELRMLAMFCAAMRRDVFTEIGPLDERYAVGLFEDEDYALRLRAAGYRVVCALDVFVHHAYHASIGKLVPTGAYSALFRANQHRFEEKWGISWESHQHVP